MAQDRRIPAILESGKAPLESPAAPMRGSGFVVAVEEFPRLIAALSSPEDETEAAGRAAPKRLEP